MESKMYLGISGITGTYGIAALAICAFTYFGGWQYDKSLWSGTLIGGSILFLLTVWLQYKYWKATD
jgi:hypothetical protein